MARRRSNEGMTDVVEYGLQFTPMIDCIFQLIIFFMVNVKFRSMEGLLKAFLPRVASTPVQEDLNKDKVFITLREASPGNLLVAVNNKPMAGTSEVQKYAALEERLKDIKQSYDKMPPVIVDGDARLPYKYVVYALNVCGKLKLADVMFMFPQE